MTPSGALGFGVAGGTLLGVEIVLRLGLCEKRTRSRYSTLAESATVVTHKVLDVWKLSASTLSSQSDFQHEAVRTDSVNTAMIPFAHQTFILLGRTKVTNVTNNEASNSVEDGDCLAERTETVALGYEVSDLNLRVPTLDTRLTHSVGAVATSRNHVADGHVRDTHLTSIESSVIE